MFVLNKEVVPPEAVVVVVVVNTSFRNLYMFMYEINFRFNIMI